MLHAVLQVSGELTFQQDTASSLAHAMLIFRH